MTTDTTTQTPTEWLKQRHLDIELEIEDRAKTNGHFAIAHALLRLTEVLDDRLAELSAATSAIGDAIGYAPLDRLADAAEALVEAVGDLKPKAEA